MNRDFATQYAKLNSAQKQAVDTIDGPVLVIAGPGTGKTHLLTLRTANILQKTDVAPQNILCLTYTEVGARNLRERLTQVIGQPAYDVRISTYHGFGSDILRNFGEYFSEYGDQQPIDRLGQDSILHEIFETLPASNPLWRADTYLKDSLDFITEAKNALLSPSDIKAIAKANRTFVQDASKLSQQILAPVIRMDKKSPAHFAELRLALSPLVTTTELPQNIQPLANLAFDQLNKALEHFESSGKTTELTKWKNTWLIKNATNEWVFAGERECDKLDGAAAIYEQYNTALTDAKLYDYSDMITRAIHALATHDELRFSLQEQYLYIMLDEFQDTNLSQLKLVELLTNNPNDNGRPNVLAVGDDDQAIFSFQGADLTNMLRFTQNYTNVTLLSLTENYRSHTAILQTAAGIANQIEERLSTALGNEPKQLEAKNSSITDAKIQRLQYKSDIAQYDSVARRINDLIAAGTSPEEIAVLAPQHRYLEPLVPYLHALKIPIRYDKRENVLDDTHIMQLTTMAELLVSLSNDDHDLADSLLPAVLSADFWNIPTSKIWQLSWQANQNRYKADVSSHWLPLMLDDITLQPIALFFVKLAALSATETLESMLDYLVGVTPLSLNENGQQSYISPYYEYYFGKKAQGENAIDFSHTLSNLTVLRQHLREYRRTSESPLMIRDYLQFIADYRAANEKLLNTSPYHSSQQAVQLLTAYGSKGLEFEVVFVLATQNDVWGMGARNRHSNISLPQNLQIIRRAGTTKDEKKRLFYVALTRAKHSLYLTSYAQNYAGKTSSALEFMNESDDISAILPPAFQNVIIDDTEVVAQNALVHYWTTRHVPNGLQQPELRELLLPKLENFQLTATHLNSFTNLAFGGPESFFITSILRFPKAPSAAGQYGSAMHETLESLQYSLIKNGNLPTTKQAIALFSDKLKAKRLSQHDFVRQFEIGSNALRVFLEQWGHNFVPEARSETDFKHEAAFIDDVHLSGKLDQMLIDTDSKAIKVIDFKTGKSHDKWTKEVNMHKYRQQLLFYKLLVEHSHSYNGFSVEEGSLVFVEPDEFGTINELSLDYDSAELQRIELLIKAVWRCITTLDFPDTSQFTPDLKGIVEFEEWLIANRA